MKRLILITCLVYFITGFTFAQDKPNEPGGHYEKLEEKYKKLKDSMAILHPFIPAVSPVMMDHRQLEINVFNSLISAKKYRSDNGDLYDLDGRTTYFYNTLQLTYGLSENSRFNAGFDINTVMGRRDENRNSSPFKVFGSKGFGNNQDAKAVTSIAPRIRWRPFKRNYRFTIQSSIIFPTGISDDKESILGRNQNFFLTQFLYNLPLNQRLFLFSQLSIEYGFERTAAPALLVSPLSVYLSYLVPKKTILFILANYIPVFTKADNWKYNQHTFQIGGGVQYQFSKRILINAYYTNDIAGKNYYDFTGYNLSARFLIH